MSSYPSVTVAAVLGLKVPVAHRACPSSPLQAGFREAYRAHFRLVWRGLRRLGVAESSLEDAVQDVFLVVHRRWQDFRGHSQLKTWIYGITVKVAKDYRRSEARQSRRVRRLTELSQAEPTSVAPTDQAARREAHRVLHRALGTLNDEERALFVLIELEELSMREAAEALGLRLRTCQRRLKSARAAFEAAVSQLTAARSIDS